MKKESLDRRDFLKTASAAGVGAFAASRGIGPLFAFEGSPTKMHSRMDPEKSTVRLE